MKNKKAKAFSAAFRKALTGYEQELNKQVQETPYGVPYRPNIWGAGWDIQRFGFQHYFLTTAYPEIFPKAPVFNALNFILGCHPGSNQASFASGVGAQSATVGYGLNRADWSYIPGGESFPVQLLSVPTSRNSSRSRSSGSKLSMCWEEVHPTICSWYLQQNSC